MVQRTEFNRCIIRICAIGGGLAVVLSLQQKTFLLLSERCIYQCGLTRIEFSRTSCWTLSLISAAVLFSAVLLLPGVSRRLIMVIGVALLFWSVGYLFFFNSSPFLGGYLIVLPASRWQESDFWRRVRLDPTYSLGNLLGAWQVVLAIYLICRSYPWPRPGFCRKCDYDLTGNVSGVCPECGSPIRRRIWVTH